MLIVGSGWLGGADENRTLARLRALCSDNATGPEAVRMIHLRRTVAGIHWPRLSSGSVKGGAHQRE
jgi:hypothetical protein